MSEDREQDPDGGGEPDPDAPSGAATPALPEQVDPRALAAWREWLDALATDAEAALAAAQLYGDLPAAARDAWLDALAEDLPKLRVPAVAVYAPLLAVEADPPRRSRIALALEASGPPEPERGFTRALRGIAADGARLVAVVTPAYLDFVRVLLCRFNPYQGIVWARQDALVGDGQAPCAGYRLDGIPLEPTPLKPVIEELCHAILAHSRKGGALPEALQLCADLFDAHIEGETLP